MLGANCNGVTHLGNRRSKNRSAPPEFIDAGGGGGPPLREKCVDVQIRYGEIYGAVASKNVVWFLSFENGTPPPYGAEKGLSLSRGLHMVGPKRGWDIMFVIGSIIKQYLRGLAKERSYRKSGTGNSLKMIYTCFFFPSRGKGRMGAVTYAHMTPRSEALSIKHHIRSCLYVQKTSSAGILPKPSKDSKSPVRAG